MGKGEVKMLLINLIVQAIVAFISIFFICLAVNLKKARPNSKISFLRKESNCRTLKIICIVLAVLTGIYYCYDVLFLNNVESFSAGLKISLYALAIVLFFLFISLDNEDAYKFRGGYTLIVILACMFFAVCFIKMDESYSIELKLMQEYNAKIIKQDPQVNTYKYELLSATDGSKIVGSIDGSLSANVLSRFFVQHTTIDGSVDGEIKQIDVYKFYYIANCETGEIRPKTLEAESTPLFYVEEGEKPYLLKKEVIPYSLNYNKNPPEVCNVGEKTISYELHIPKDSIVENFRFDASN